MAGSVRLHTIRINRILELVARVRAHEYLNAMTYAAIKRAVDWNKMASLSDMLCWIELDRVVIVLTTVPTDTWSSLLIG
jgi:hypothetical protein